MDTTGNIMVDIADGIGMVSKGIEALEYWLDPDSKPAAVTPPPSSAADTGPSSPSPESPAPSPAPAPAPADPGTQPKVFCQKGKCYPYDPARMKNPNLNLEMKPGKLSFITMILSNFVPSVQA